jgi:hypothetical protein
LNGDDVVKRWAVPIVVTLIGAMTAGPIVGLLAGILAALVWPPLAEWWNTHRYLQAVARQDRFLEEYDVCAVSPVDYERMRLATWGETDPSKAFLLDRKTMRKAKLTYPTKAKTEADKKARWDQEEERRRSLGFPSQSMRREYQAEWPYYKPHYEHLKSGIKVRTCWLCDQNNAEQDQSHREIWERVEHEEAEEKAKSDSADALFCIGEIPPANTLRCEEAEQFYARLKSKYTELHAATAASDWKGRAAINDGHSLILRRINAARACGKYGPCTVHTSTA